MFGPELAVKEVKPKVSSPSLPSKTFSRAKRERIRKGLIGERTLMKEEKKARRAARSAEKRLARGGDGERKSAVKRVYCCKESVDATIRKVLGKTAKTKVAAKSEVNAEKVRKGTPGSNSSMRSTSHEARQERKLKGPIKLPTSSDRSSVSLFPQPDTSNARSVSDQVTICDVGPEEWLEMDPPPANSQEEQVALELMEPCNVRSLAHPVTISDIGMEEWLEVPTPCDPESQITLDLSGPEQWPMEPMPPCMEFFKVEVFSVMMKCTSIIFFNFLRGFILLFPGPQ